MEGLGMDEEPTNSHHSKYIGSSLYSHGEGLRNAGILLKLSETRLKKSTTNTENTSIRKAARPTQI